MKEKLLKLIIEIKFTFPVILTDMVLIELIQNFFKKRDVADCKMVLQGLLIYKSIENYPLCL
ncbi:MAG: hypothetical protein EA359_19470 [Balneolaceae bacterium]|nr:MAG: hypothetical protein EA359_19470 [Balneolaceae bacterium]